MMKPDGSEQLTVRLTTDSGFYRFTSLPSTAYPFTSYGPGYIFPPATITTNAGTATFSDSIFGYNFYPGDPADVSMKRIYGWIERPGGTAVSGAIVTLLLRRPNADNDSLPVLTATGVAVTLEPAIDTTDANGYWSIDVYPVDAITPASCYYEWMARKAGYTLPGMQATICPDSTNAQNIDDVARCQ
jgi:hypothetical protein